MKVDIIKKTKKVFILHGMSGCVDSSFGLKLKQDLTNIGYEIVPEYIEMSNTRLSNVIEEENGD